VTDDVGELFAELCIEDDYVGTGDYRCERDVCESDTLADKICACSKVRLDSVQSTESALDKSSVELRLNRCISTVHSVGLQSCRGWEIAHRLVVGQRANAEMVGSGAG
jgi:hypothetical protein